MAERFTIRYGDNYYCKIKDSDCHRYNKDNDVCCCGCGIAEKMTDKLGNYEDLEESLEKTYGKCDGLLETAVKYLADHKGVRAENPERSLILTDEDAEKWLRWKAAEAAGRLMEPPCKPMDIVYVPHRSHIQKMIVLTAKIDTMGFWFFEWKVKDGIGIFPWLKGFSSAQIGKDVFLTEQEAMEAPEEVKHE